MYPVRMSHLGRTASMIVALCLGLLLASFGGGTANAQVDVQIRVNFPVIRFETAPPLVVVSPGVQVVEDYDEEIFFVSGWYWYRWQGGWYRRRNYQAGEWVVVAPARVPRTLVRIPPGHYKHYKGKGHGKKAEPMPSVGSRFRPAPAEHAAERDHGNRAHGGDRNRGNGSRGHGKGKRK